MADERVSNDIRSQYSLLQNEPGADDVKLPRDVFSSRFCYYLTTRKIVFICLLLVIVLICVFAIWLKVSGCLYLLPFLLFVLTTPVYVIFSAAIRDKGKCSREDTLDFLREVTAVQPGLDGKKWDLIAARLNRMFYVNGNATTPYFFYDGDECRRLFMYWYYNPTVNRTGTVSEIQPIVVEAVKVYDANLKDYCRRYIQVPSEAANTVSDADNADSTHMVEHSPTVSSGSKAAANTKA